MPVEPYATRLEPSDDTVIWRYMDLRKFRDLMASEELYFRRADLFTDKSEGLQRIRDVRRQGRLVQFDVAKHINERHLPLDNAALARRMMFGDEVGRD